MIAPILAGIGRFDEGKELLGKHPTVGRYVGTLMERESFQRTIPRDA